MDESIEKFSSSSAFLSSTAMTEDTSDCTGGETSFYTARNMTITDGRFFRLIPEKCAYNTTVAVCVKCEPRTIEIKGTINSSSNFICHLKRKHGPDAVHEYSAYLRTKKRYKRQVVADTSPRQLRSKDTLSQELLQQKALTFVIDSMVPLKTVVCPSFMGLFQGLNAPENDLKILSYQNLSTQIEQLFQKNRQQLRDELRATSNVFCTANVWSGQDKRFLATTAHWITTDLMRKSAALSFQRLKRSFSSEKIASILHQIQCEFGFPHTKVKILVGEYHSDFLKAMKAYGVEKRSIEGRYDSENESDSSDSNDDEEMDRIELNSDTLVPLSLDYFKCSIQTLTMCASVEVAKAISDCSQLSKLHGRVVKKCNLLWNHAGSDDILKVITGLTLTKPLAKSWTSVYSSLREILTIQDKSAEIFQAFDNKDYLQESEFLYIEEHLTWTKPFADALTILQRNEYSLFGSLLPTLFALRRGMNKLLEREWVYSHPIAEIVRIINEQFQNYYQFDTSESLYASVAALSHPEFKNRWLTCVESQYQSKILSAFNKAVTAEIPATNCHEATTASSPPCCDFFDFEPVNENAEQAAASTNAAGIEILNYFNYASRSLSSLEYFPEIKKVFLRYNTPLSSFASVEQMFNYDTLSAAVAANSLGERNNEIRVLLKANLSMLWSKYEM